jgi:hypothetical protein
VALELAKKFHVLHDGHFWEATNVQEGSAPAEYSVVAASHSQQNSGVMRKTVRQSINSASRQAYAEITADHIRIVQYARDFNQASVRDFGIDMHEPKDVTVRGTRAKTHLYRSIAFAYDNLIAKAAGKISRVIGASAVSDNNLRFWRSVTQVLKKWTYQ